MARHASATSPPRAARPSRGLIVALSGRNQLKGFIEEVRKDGLLGQVRLRIGDQTLTVTCVPPSITQQPALPQHSLQPGQTLNLSVAAAGSPPLTYQWTRNNVNIAGATASTYTINNVQPSDSGAVFRVRVTAPTGKTLLSARIEMTGQRFGRLTVTELDAIRSCPRTYWWCKCDCGNVVSVVANSLRRGNSQSCGCAKYLTRWAIHTIESGMTFGRLTVLNLNGRDQYGSLQWMCKCSCGNRTTVTTARLRNGSKPSCGCLYRERQAALSVRRTLDLHGHRIGRLLVLGIARRGAGVVWRCQCDCGVAVELRSSALRGGGVKSCGCLQRENYATLGALSSERARSARESQTAQQRSERKEARAAYVRVGARKAAERLTDSYIRNQLGMLVGEATPELIELKREQLRLHRALVDFKQAIEEPK
jgi:hypothetical protein